MAIFDRMSEDYEDTPNRFSYNQQQQAPAWAAPSTPAATAAPSPIIQIPTNAAAAAPSYNSPQVPTNTTPAQPSSITSRTPGLTPGQVGAYQYLEGKQATTWKDFVPSEAVYGKTGLDAFLEADQNYQSALQGDQLDSNQIANAKAKAIALYQGKSTEEAATTLRQEFLNTAQSAVDWWNANPNGHHESPLDKFMFYVFPAVVGAFVGAGAIGAMGGAGAAGAAGAGAAEGAGGLATVGSAGADVALGSLSTAGLGLESLGNIAVAGEGLGATGAAGLGAGSAAGGLGSMIATGSTPAVVNVTAPALGATTGGLGGLAGAGAVGGGLIGLENILGSDPQLPLDRAPLEDMGQINGPTETATTPPGAPTGGGGVIGDTGVPDGNGDVSLGGNGPGSGLPGSGTIGGGLPGGVDLGDIIGGIGNVIGGNHDRITNQQDMAYWQGMMDKLMGMYAPGSPEAEMMRHKMEAQDAAAGRNSQYGIREQNLAAILADQRAKIMTNPTFYKMGEAARGHYDNSLNSLFSLLGSGGGGGSGGLGSLFGLGSSLGGLGSLSSLFGNNNMFSPGSYI